MATPNTMFAAALQHYHRGQFDEAKRLFTRLVDDACSEHAPQDAESRRYLGLIAYHRGELLSAEGWFREAVAINARSAVYFNHLGLTLLDQKQFREAEDCFDDALRIAPDYFIAHFNRGLVLHEQGRCEEAASAYRRAVEIDATNAAAWNNLGLVLNDLHRLDEGAECFSRALKLEPNSVAAMNNLGQTRHNQRRYEDAVQCFLAALRAAPNEAILHNNLGLTLHAQQKLQEALHCFHNAVRLRPDYDDAQHNAGDCLLAAGRPGQAAQMFRAALQINGRRADSMLNLGIIAAFESRFEEAASCFRQSLQFDPQRTDAYYQLSLLDDAAVTEKDIADLKKLVDNSRLGDSDLAFAHFALGNILDWRGEYDEAFAHFSAGNQLRCASFDPQAHERLVRSLIAAFSGDALARIKRSEDTRTPIFIVGMPRSGTTLVEQIISCHHETFCAGELSVVNALADSFRGNRNWEQAIAESTPSQIGELTKMFWRHFPRQAANYRVVIDKTPANFLQLGLIAMMFPNCRILHCRRHPLDTCLSCFFQNFESIEYSFNLEHLARYYIAYRTLMEHWESILPISITTIQYEDLIDDQQGASERILAACNLDWDEECLKFYQNRRSVATSSAWQVRQPIYRRSAGRWKNYKCHIAPLIESLKHLTG